MERRSSDCKGVLATMFHLWKAAAEGPTPASPCLAGRSTEYEEPDVDGI